MDLFVAIHVSNYAHGLETSWQQIEMIKRMQKSKAAKGRVLWNSCSGTIKDNNSVGPKLYSIRVSKSKSFCLDSLTPSTEHGMQDIDGHSSTSWQIPKLPEGLHLLYSLLNNMVTRSFSFTYKFQVLQFTYQIRSPLPRSVSKCSVSHSLSVYKIDQLSCSNEAVHCQEEQGVPEVCQQQPSLKRHTYNLICSLSPKCNKLHIGWTSTV